MTIVNLFVFIIFIHVITNPVYSYIPAQGQETDGATDYGYIEGELLVRFAPEETGIQRTTEEKNQILTSLGGGTIKESYNIVPGLSLVKLPTGLTVEDAQKTFNNKEGILYAHPNYILKALSTIPNDPCFIQQWGMNNTGQIHPKTGGGFSSGTPDADIDAPEAWDIHKRTDIVVAVIDSGVDYTHPDLAVNMWHNPGEIPGNGIDDDHNGYVDDIYGYDFCTWGGKLRDSDPLDDFCHGTHCAGIIGAVGNNGIGVTGVCWNVKIMALKFISHDNHGYTSDAIKCIEYAVSKGAKVLSNSWGYPSNPGQGLKDAIDAANTAGVLFVAPAGNDGFPRVDYPAAYTSSNIISVLATNHNDQKWSFSNYHSVGVDLGAPGEDILSTFPTYQTAAMTAGHYSTYYETISGTSMSTPYVAGACALIWAMNPQLTHLQVKQIILDTVDKNCGLYLKCVTQGRLNLHKAIIEASKNRQSLSVIPDVNGCVEPFDEIDFDINWDANGFADTNSFIVDYLPEELDYDSSQPEGQYDEINRTVTWSLDNIGANEYGTVQISTKLNKTLCPCSKVKNVAALKGDSCYNKQTSEVTVCNWGPDIIYVDKDANDVNDSSRGTSWENAYTDIQDALDIARNCPDSLRAIWVAAGTYKPSKEADCFLEYKGKSYELISGVSLFGHFAGNETGIDERNFSDANNETVLEAQVGESGQSANVIKAAGIVDSLVDGFTVRYAGVDGIYLNNSNVSIKNCRLQDNYSSGINCTNVSRADIRNCLFTNTDYYSPDSAGCGLNVEGNGSVAAVFNCIFDGMFGGNEMMLYGVIKNNNSSVEMNCCTVKNCTSRGISSSGGSLSVINSILENNGSTGLYNGSCNLTLKNSIIRNNGWDGVYVGLNNSAAPIITNNWINNNTGNGLSFQNQNNTPIIRNNTICRNSSSGISSNYGNDPNIRNCIIYYNGQDFGGTSGNVKYCCLQNGNLGQSSNITVPPDFMNPSDPNDLHLGGNLTCVDKGDPSGSYGSETDIDGEARVMDGDANSSVIVDIGADEYYWSRADFDRDGDVDFIDYAKFAYTWRRTVQNGNFTIYDLNHNLKINCGDLKLFCNDWLWEAAWLNGWMYDIGEGLKMMAQGGESSGFVIEKAAAELSVQEAAEQPLVRTEADVKDILEWMDKVELESQAEGLSSGEDYKEFRQSLEKELISLLSQGEK
jgi:subtilisin family serine protease